MKLEQIINANLVHSGSDEYDFDFDFESFKDGELVIISRKNTKELVKELQAILLELDVKLTIKVYEILDIRIK